MRMGSAIMVLLGVVAMPGISVAAHKSGVGFTHKDWELSCDNTGTCRAAGYQADGVEPAVSLLLVRSAGSRQVVTAQIQLGTYGESDSALAEGVKELAIKAGGRTIGKIGMTPGAEIATLTGAALAALMPALLQAPGVTFSSGKQEWRLSTAGASAVLLKMDEVQGRIGTIGAVVRKGSKPEDGVVKPVAAPIVIAAPVTAANSKDVLLTAPQRAALLKELRQTVDRDECRGLYSPQAGEKTIELDINRLSATKLIASVVCETYAYNQSSLFWVVNARAPFAPVNAASDATEYGNGEIVSAQKGRGLGDCFSSSTYTWDGAQFVMTKEATSGMCRLVAPGGAWDLPTYVATVRKAATAR